MALSTTHVATGSILGSGVGKPGAEVRWAVAGRMAVAWLITLPAAGLVGALAYWLSDAVKSLTNSMLAGDGLIFVILVGPVLLHVVARPAAEGGQQQRQRAIGTPRRTPSCRPNCVRPSRNPSPRRRSSRRDQKETLMTYLESILKVLAIGLLLGAGLPAVFAAGLVAYSNGAGGQTCRRHHGRAQPGGEVPGHRTVRVRRLGDPDRRHLDHQGERSSITPVSICSPSCPRNELRQHDREPDCSGQRARLAAPGLPGGCAAEGLLCAARTAEALAHRGRGHHRPRSRSSGSRTPTR